MNILFVTRKYPPSTGGMENAAFELYTALAVDNAVTLIKWGGSNKLLPIVYVWLFVQALWSGIRHRPDVIYLQDGLMGPLGWLLKVLLRRPTVITVHGMEATYANPLYRAIVPPFIVRQTRIVTGSQTTTDMVKKGLPGADPVIITYGVRDVFYQPKPRLEHLAVIAGESGIPLAELQGKKLLHTNGRLIRRKGVLWFVDNVMPVLAANKDILYLISGTGKDKELIAAALAEHKLEASVKLLGRVSDPVLHALYNAADLFIMPNIPVANDIEGFGLVALEAASCDTPVITANIEGMKDAIIQGKNGLLVESGDTNAYVQTITRELDRSSFTPGEVREYTISHYSWPKCAREHQALMQSLLDQ